MNENKSEAYTDMGNTPHQEDFDNATNNKEKIASIVAEIKSQDSIIELNSALAIRKPENAKIYNERVNAATSRKAFLEAELTKYS